MEAVLKKLLEAKEQADRVFAEHVMKANDQQADEDRFNRDDPFHKSEARKALKTGNMIACLVYDTVVGGGHLS